MEEIGQQNTILSILPQPENKSNGQILSLKLNQKPDIKSSNREIERVPAGDVEPGEAGEEAHDERGFARGGGGRGRGFGVGSPSPLVLHRGR